MDRRLFLQRLGFGVVAPIMVEPIMTELKRQGLLVEPLALMEPVEKQQALTRKEILLVYRATLESMEIHNEAIDRMTGKWEELNERRARISDAQAAHKAKMDELWAGRHERRRLRELQQWGARKNAARRRIKDLRRTPKPRLP